MKLKILQWLTGKFGPLVTPVLSSLIGTAVGLLYDWLGDLVARVPALEFYLSRVWSGLSPEVQTALSPTAVGTVCAVAAYAVIQELLTRFYVKDVKQQQEQINKLLDTPIEVDGIPLEETRVARKEVNKAAEVAIRNMRGGKG